MLCVSLFREMDAVFYTAQQGTLWLGSLLRSDCAANAEKFMLSNESAHTLHIPSNPSPNVMGFLCVHILDRSHLSTTWQNPCYEGSAPWADRVLSRHARPRRVRVPAHTVGREVHIRPGRSFPEHARAWRPTEVATRFD